MKNKEIKKKINKSLTNSIPDKFNEILLQCEKKKGKRIMNKKEKIKEKSKRNYIPKVSFALALITLVFGITYFGYNKTYKVESIIELDVNPSIELKINQKDQVIEAVAKNDDAKNVLENMELEKIDIDVALNAIIGSMVTKGYIDDLSNSILLSVENDDVQKSEQLREKLVTKINNILNNDKINGSVLSQNLSSTNNKATTLANDYNISEGKASLILEILESNKLLTEKDLVGLTINELNVLSERNQTTLKTVEKEGNASTKAYIGKTKAKQIALNHAEVSNHENLEIEFDADNGIIVYEVDFNTATMEYEYEINAITGKIIKTEKEKNDEYHSSNTANTNSNTSNSTTNETKSTTKAYIGKTKAKQIALNHAGVSNPKNLEIEFDENDNEYSVEFKYNGYEYEYEINATTGIIKNNHKEKDKY